MQIENYNLPHVIFKIILYILTFLTPLLFLPTTFEFYNFNKESLIFLCLILMLITLGWQTLYSKSIRIYKSPLSIPILLFLLICLISTLFSLSPLTSWIGYYGRLYGGFFSILGFVIMYFFVSNQIEDKEEINSVVAVLSSSMVVLSIITILQRLQVYLLPNTNILHFTHSPVFSPSGDFNTLPYLFALTLPLAISQILNAKNLYKKLLFFIANLIIILAFILSSITIMPWITLIIVLCIYSLYIFTQSERFFKVLFSYLLVFTFIVGAGFNLFVQNHLKVFSSVNSSTVIQLPQDITWNIVGQTLANSPQNALIGSGPDTFFYDFISRRPLSYLNQSYWQQTFSVGGSALLNILGEIGFIGILAYAVLIIFIFRYIYQIINYLSNSQDDYDLNLSWALSAAILGYFVSNIFVYSTSTLSFVLWLSLALIVAIRNSYPDLRDEIKYIISLILKIENSNSEGDNILYKVAFGTILIISLSALFLLGQNYIAETIFASSQYDDANNNISSEYTNSKTAVSMQPYKDYFNRAMAVSSINMAYDTISQNKNNTKDASVQDEVKKYINNSLVYSSNSISLNNVDVNNYVIAALVNQKIALVITNTPQNYVNNAIGNMNTATSLDPLDLNLKDTLASWYYQVGDFNDSQNLFEGITKLKDNIAKFHYDLAHMLISEISYNISKNQQNNNNTLLTQQAISELQTALSLVPKNSSTYNQIQSQIQQLHSGNTPSRSNNTSSNIQNPTQNNNITNITPTPSGKHQ